MTKHFLFLTAILLALAPFAQTQEGGLTYDIRFKGVSRTLTGEKFKFTAQGTMNWNPTTGEVSFDTTTSAGVHFTGTGTLAMGEKGLAFGLTQITFGEGPSIGSAVFTGKFKKGTAKFSGKVTAGSPSRLGPPPDGFVLTTGKVKAALTTK